MEKLRLGIVDINGTIHTDTRGISQPIRSGFKQLHDTSVITTVATGRSLKRAGELLGRDWGTIVSVGAPVSVENGGRLITQSGQNLRYYPMHHSTIESALDVVSNNLSEVSFVAYYPKQPDQGAVLWTPNGGADAAREEFIQRHGEPEITDSRPLSELARKLEEDTSCMLIVNFKSSGMEEAFANANIVVNGPELNVLETGISKGKGVEDIADVLQMPLNTVFVAGNDHNDIPMFALPVRKKLLVGDIVKETMPDVIQVQTPEALGAYLNTSLFT